MLFKKNKNVVDAEVEGTVEVQKKKNGIFPKILIGAGLIGAGLFAGKLLKKSNDKINEEYDSDYSDSGDFADDENTTETD